MTSSKACASRAASPTRRTAKATIFLRPSLFMTMCPWAPNRNEACDNKNCPDCAGVRVRYLRCGLAGAGASFVRRLRPHQNADAHGHRQDVSMDEPARGDLDRGATGGRWRTPGVVRRDHESRRSDPLRMEPAL